MGERAAMARPGKQRERSAPDADGKLATSTRRRIERAALAVFIAQGVDAATTREIAAKAGLSEGALYRHFPSKSALAEALFIETHDRLAALVRNAAQNADTLNKKVAAVVAAYCDTADADWALFSYHLLNTSRFVPTRSTDANPVDAAKDIFAAAMAQGEIEPGDAELLTAMTLGVVLQTALHKLYGRLDEPLRNYAPAMTRAIHSILLPSNARKARRS
jgi:AcrR family transcriptional regulator